MRFHIPADMKKKKQQPRKLKAKPKKSKKTREKVPTADTSQASGSDRPPTESFLDEMIRWFSDHQRQVDELFGHSDTDRSGLVHPKDFELGLMNLNVSCQQFQLRMLTQQLKTDGNTISYRDLSRQVQRLSLSDVTEISSQVSEDASRSDRCAHRQLLNPEKDRFIRLSVRLIPFDGSAAHPANFEVVLSSSGRVFSLIRMIQDRVGIQTSSLEVFRSRMATEETRLPPESSLEECGFKGGPEETPPEDTVYYDYRLLFTDCPILNCDHYFRSNSAAVRTNHRP